MSEDRAREDRSYVAVALVLSAISGCAFGLLIGVVAGLALGGGW
ncbi:hypothetical protein [Xanthobacter sp. KR7-225]